MTDKYRIEEILAAASHSPYQTRQWQSLAATGCFVDAIKMVRNLTDAGLKETKDAVEYWINEHRNKVAKTYTVFSRPDDTGRGTETVTVTEYGDGEYSIARTTTTEVRNLGELLKIISNIE